MPDRALEEAALRAFVLKEAELAGWDVDEAHIAVRSEVWRPEVAAAIDALFGALRRELPEHAIDAMMESGGRSSTTRTRKLCERWAQAFLAALTGEGPPDADV